MNTRTVEATLKNLRRQLRELERQRDKLINAIRALDELTNEQTQEQSGRPARKRRQGTSPLVDAAAFVLKTATEPMHVMELVRAMQQNGIYRDRSADKLRASLVSTLLRRGDLFSNPSRGFYGLKEWDTKET